MPEVTIRFELGGTTPPPAGTRISEGDDIAGILNNADPGQVFNVDSGAVFPGAVIDRLPDGVKVYGNPEKPFVLDGGGTVRQAFKGSHHGGLIQGMVVRNYGGYIQPSWFGTRRFGDRAPYAADLTNWEDFELLDSLVAYNDSGLRIPHSGRVVRCQGHRNLHSNIVGSGSNDVWIEDWSHTAGNYQWVYDDGYEAACKFVACTNITIRGWVGNSNNGVGLWPDYLNSHFDVQDVICSDNASKGISYEVCQGPAIFRNVETLNNGGAAGLHFSNSRGTQAAPILVDGFTAGGHRGPWEVAVQDNASRSPRAGYITFRNGVIGGSKTPLAVWVQGNNPVPPGIVVENVTKDGQPVMATVVRQ